jgi:steroid delta-isomerase-like uncharacterized protein
MSTAANKALVQRYFDERWNHGNLDVIDELVAPSLDIEGMKAWCRSMYASFGNIQLTILDMLAEGDQVALRYRSTGTHQGDYLGVAATGKTWTIEAVSWLRILDGKIVEDNGYWDNLDILRQLGASPIPEK